MKNTLILLFFLALAGCAGPQAAIRAQDMSFSTMVKAPGMTSEEIFDKTNAWVNENLQASRAERTSGTITAEGDVDYPAPSADRTDHFFAFTMENEISGGTNLITFRDITLNAPVPFISEAYTTRQYTGGNEIRIVSERDREAARKALADIAGDLVNFLKGSPSALEKCATCGALFTSPECLERHMERHLERP